MDINRLKSMRAGNRAVITKNLKKMEETLETEDTEELLTLLEAVENKKKTLVTIDEQILSEVDSEGITQEVLETDEYYLDLESKVRKFKKLVNRTTPSLYSVLRSNAPEFIPQSNPFTSNLNRDFTQPSTSSASSQNHRLPKLSLPTFNGDILEWQYFWDSFESTVHHNHTLTDIQKFSYLKSLLELNAANVITGLTMTNLNYHKAIDLLKSRYGQTHKIINAYMRALLDMPQPDGNLESLRIFYDKSEAYIRGLESLGQSQEMFGSLLIPVVLGKLPSEFRKTITRENGCDDWNIQKLRDAIGKEISVQESGNIDYMYQRTSYTSARYTANLMTGVGRKMKKSTSKSSYTQSKRQVNSTPKRSCVYCEGDHLSNDCASVTDHSARMNIIKEKKLCFNCFGTHKVSECRSKFDCKICHRKHHTSLCLKTTQTTCTSADSDKTKDKTDASVLYTSASQETTTVLLKTAIAQVMSGNNCTEANVLFDEGAQRSFITEDLAQKLNTKIEGSESLTITSFGNSANGVRNLNKTTIQLRADNGEIIPIKVLIVPTITSPLQNQCRKITQSMRYLRGLKLAHPVTDADSFEISLLVGADFYWNIVQDKIVRGNGPIAVESKIGYLLSGPVPAVTNRESLSSCMMNILISHKQENTDLEKFWKLETMGIDSKEVNSQLTDAMDTFVEASISQNNGKYVTKLPWKENGPELPTNKEVVRRRTESVIRRISKDEKLMKMYGDIIAEQEKRGFIERVHAEGINTENMIHYIPHHPVQKDSLTTPIRIVYNCSCRASKDSASLNDCLADYPPMMNDLTAILTRFRLEKYAVTADIEKAFLQIGLDEKDRDVTRFFWLEDPTDVNSPLITYRFKVVLFGATCSPFLLSATLMKHFRDHPSATSTELQRNLYVDNALTSFPDETSLLNFYRESRKLLADAGFNLRTWNSNNKLLRNITAKDNTADDESVIKILGMKWDTNSDKIMYQQLKLTKNNEKMLTKREVLSQSSSIFDPLGLISPVTVNSKLFMQRLWREKLNWDDMLPENFQKDWTTIASEIEQATKTEVSRNLTPGCSGKEMTLHVFADASQKAYGACAYLVRGNSTSLIMSKNRVAPVNTISLPRLELMGALIAAKLASHILGFVETKKILFWSDSQIVLSWLSSTKTLTPFVANRIKEIKKLVGNSEWRYCPTDQNPADYLTRGITAEQLKNNSLWFDGPQWITDQDKWPLWTRNVENCSTLTTEKEECIGNTDIHVHVSGTIPTNRLEMPFNIENYSSYKKLVRISAYVLRFIHNLKTNNSERITGALDLKEVQNAEITLIRIVQHASFEKEIDNLHSSSNEKIAIVRQLRLYLDEYGLIRSAGRINNAPVDYDTKYPILLPNKHHLTTLIVNDAHNRIFHAGLNSTIAHIQQKFWIPRIRQCVKYHLRNCVTCIRVTGKPYQSPEPPPLPKVRVHDEYPFYATGVDFTGALLTKESNNNDSKAFICLFTCAATRAIHLEIVPDLTEESFILAFRRFVARRSIPRIMMSDNATTFKAAAERIKTLHDKPVEWKFIPNRAPWFGGWWERLIGLTKNAIKKVLGRSFVKMDMLRTIVTEIESVLNNRPMTYISTDITDPQPLTPSHLLYGRRLDSLPYPSEDVEKKELTFNHTKCNKQMERQNQLLEHFRTRWRNEYLTSLREFHRTTGNNIQTIKKGDVVQVYSDSNRIMWKLAVVQDLIHGKDGFVRSAIIKTDTGITNRPIVKLYPLECNGPNSEVYKPYSLRTYPKTEDH